MPRCAQSSRTFLDKDSKARKKLFRRLEVVLPVLASPFQGRVSRHLQYMFGTSNLHKHFNTRYALFDDGIKSPWERPAVTSAFAIASPGSTQHLHKTLIPGTLHVPVVVLEKLL